MQRHTCDKPTTMPHKENSNMPFQAPTKDLLFNIKHLSNWSAVADLAPYGDVDFGDAEAVVDELARFCSDQIAPLNAPGDIAGSTFENGRVAVPAGFKSAYSNFVEMGWQSLPHPADFGGQGLPRVVGAAATEMLNAANMSFALCPLLTDGAIEALLTAGSDAMKTAYLPNLIAGKWSGTMNLTEPQAGSDLAQVRTRAERHDDGSYRITGTKIFITYGEHDMSENIVHLVLARLPDAPKGVKGISLFLVPKFIVNPDETLGAKNSVRCVSIEHKLGITASPTAVLEFETATGYIIGEENCGLNYMFEMMNSARFSVGVQGVAISERAYQQALSFARERIQSAPVDGSTRDAVAIINHPDVRRMLMRMRAQTEGGRALAAYGAGWQDIARHAKTPQERKDAAAIAEFLVPLIKGLCTENAIETTSLGVQIHGGMGFIEETGAAQHYRDARILPIYEGTTAIQANDLLGRKTLRDGGKTALKIAQMVNDTEQELANGTDAAKSVGVRLGRARIAFENVVAYMTNTMNGSEKSNPDAAFAGSVPYLLLAGNMVAGWQLARALLIAEIELARGEDPEFMAAKIATARFYADHILIEAELQCDRIINGADSLLCADL